jgi:hypothetical protein
MVAEGWSDVEFDVTVDKNSRSLWLVGGGGDMTITTMTKSAAGGLYDW